ncbi:hypothetical protein [Nonomuraea sp. NPDC052265]|uniref:hypothetical protein n=1 Tax=Nonomuraea sp. NPDC052265 TaxID=3364374 RepID=UPI0037C81FB8
MRAQVAFALQVVLLLDRVGAGRRHAGTGHTQAAMAIGLEPPVGHVRAVENEDLAGGGGGQMGGDPVVRHLGAEGIAQVGEVFGERVHDAAGLGRSEMVPAPVSVRGARSASGAFREPVKERGT